MFLYLIAFAAALLTIFGFSSARNSLCDILSSRHELGRFLSIFRLFSTRNDFICQDERKPEDRIAEEDTKLMQDTLKSADGKCVLQKRSNESCSFDYETPECVGYQDDAGRSSYSKRDVDNLMVPQDMWNILKNTAVPPSERKNAETLFEALLQETLKESRSIENEAFNKTQIIDEATFEKMLDEQIPKKHHQEYQDKSDHQLPTN